MNRKLYKLPFRRDSIPQWECPKCAKGILTVVKDTFHSEESSESKKARGCEAWDPDWIDYVYCCMLQCNNTQCKEVVSSSGKGNVDFDVDYDVDGYPEQVWSDFYRPKHFQPHLNIFTVPNDTPESVKEQINKSFEVFFSSPSSASNSIRVALEELLTDLKVKRYQVKGGKRMFINLHKRINLLPSKYKEFKELFLAVKWLGNAGSHSSNKITLDDVMDSYEIMDLALNRIYENTSKTVEKLAKDINKRRGPQKK